MKIITIVGARPQFIKAAVVSSAIREHNMRLAFYPSPIASCTSPITEVLIHTGQHYDFNMSDVFFQELGIPEPGYFLGVGSGEHGEQTGKMLMEIEKVLSAEKPDMAMVYGDTNSTLAGALAASKLHIPIAHVEAGLRSYNRQMPEEINRVLTDHVSSILFCPSKAAVDNLRKEGFTSVAGNGDLIDLVASHQNLYHSPVTIHQPLVLNVGDVTFDLALQIKEKVDESEVLKKYNLRHKDFILVTIHRAENTDIEDNLRNIWGALIDLAKSGKKIFFPAHPRTINALKNHGLLDGDTPNCIILEPPIPYGEITGLENAARCVITDSGGVQKESYFFKTPCIIPRSENEWVELVESGWAVLTGVRRKKLVESVTQVWEEKTSPEWETFYGDGKAAERICEILQVAPLAKCPA